MVPINKLSYFIVTIVISLGVAFILRFIANSESIFFIIAVTGLIMTMFQLDTFTVQPNYHAVMKDRWSGKLIEKDFPEGTYWTKGFNYILVTAKDTTINEYPLKVNGYTSQGLKVTDFNLSVWVPIVQLWKYVRIGEDDAKKRLTQDMGDSTRRVINIFSDEDMRQLQQDKHLTLEALFPEKDTVWDKFRDSGLSTNPDDISFTIGDFELPKSIDDANTERVESERKAKANEFEISEDTKNIQTIIITDLISYLKLSKTLYEFKLEAIAELNIDKTIEDLTHEEDQRVTEKALALVTNKIPEKGHEKYLSPKEMVALSKEAKLEYSIRRGRTSDNNHRGFEKTNVTPIVSTGGRK
jgi:hypothetical protein